MLPRSGHAPGHLRDLLCEAIEAEYHSDGEWWQWLATEEAEHYAPYGKERAAWNAMDAKARGRWLTAQLWNTTDIVPSDYLEMLDCESGMTYAQVVRQLRRAIEDDPKPIGRPPRFAEPMIPLHTNIPRDLMTRLNAACDRAGIARAEAVREALAQWIANTEG